MKELLIACGLLLAGCGGGGGETVDDPAPSAGNEAGAPAKADPVCEAGRQVECPCPNGGKGIQACADDGSKWEACKCADVKPLAPAEPITESCGAPLSTPLSGESACPSKEKQAAHFLDECSQRYVDADVCELNRTANFACCAI